MVRYMSSVLGITKDLMRDKFKLVNKLLLLNFVELTIILATGILHQKWISYGEGLLIESSCLMYFLGLILLINNSQKVLNSNRYRLLPISELKLYFSDLVGNCLSYLYMTVITTIFFVLASYTVMGKDIFLHFKIMFEDQKALWIQNLVISGLAVILIWTGSSMIHLLMNYFGDFLKFKRQAIILKVITFGLASIIIFYTLTRMSLIGMNFYIETPNHVFEKVCLIDTLGIFLSIGIGNFLLKNYSETTC
ncbi:hypothetical protein IV63_GL001257 [Companilactobacillus crustorum]|uniref:Uncharacterized protein n=4 Tax=Companilactobacillus TaxID=2767879 RepID=A0A837RG25_9LACO|nr:hypothetical protein FD26_GL001028 [Companilactobacillus crustorum JCM 15951]KRO19658.1 hypothetical protein IV63_GL001257 [Companilactobacillus crustorum]